MSAWISLSLGRLTIRLNLFLALAAGAIWAWRPGLAARYLVLLATLVLHEMGHALVSLALRGSRARVSISPVFGWAEVERFGDRREAIVAAAGPATNLLLAGILGLAGAGLDFDLGRAALKDLALTANLLMGVGNLIPLPPTDGGRILRALRLPRAKDPEPAP